jgi:hypothetical protein
VTKGFSTAKLLQLMQITPATNVHRAVRVTEPPEPRRPPQAQHSEVRGPLNQEGGVLRNAPRS